MKGRLSCLTWPEFQFISTEPTDESLTPKTKPDLILCAALGIGDSSSPAQDAASLSSQDFTNAENAV